MSIPIRPSPERDGRNADLTVSSSEDIIKALACDRDSPFKADKGILHSSFGTVTSSSSSNIVPYPNGFVQGAIRAYQQGLHVELRPDDIWKSILTQFCFYVNSRAEELRSHFVHHEGKEKLLVISDVPFACASIAGESQKTLMDRLASSHIADVSEEFTKEMQKTLKNAELRDWFTPIFTTTDDKDIAIASMIMMATMKNYYSYECKSFPSPTLMDDMGDMLEVTFEGEVEDWENILHRVSQLAQNQYGAEVTAWVELLTPILERIIQSFREPDSKIVKEFWMQMSDAEGTDKGGDCTTYSGWITAFTYWNSHGVRNEGWERQGKKISSLEGREYPLIDTDSVPKGVVKVPVNWKAVEKDAEIGTTIVAGLVGVCITNITTEWSQPLSEWWMFQESRKPLA